MKYVWTVPEVTQISQMDCGPSCLKSVLQGFNIPVHFGRLREACQTGVDGTSVDTIETLACELGLDAQQVLVPINHLHLPEAKATPSILITLLPNNLTHFIVVWRSFGPWAQVMDPSHGRHWIRWKKLKQLAYIHRMPLTKDVWEGWANGDEYRLALARRLETLGFLSNEVQEQFSKTFQEINENPAIENSSIENSGTENWLPISCLDAAVTWTESLLNAKALKKGNEAKQFLHSQYKRALESHRPWEDAIPPQYWWAIQDEELADSLRVDAAVLVRIEGVAEKNNTEEAQEHSSLSSRINVPEVTSWATLKNILLPQQRKLAFWLVPIIVAAAASVALQALLFQGLLGMSSLIGQQQEFSSFVPMLFLFIVLSTVMELPIAKITLALGRQIETQFRVALFNKIPKIYDPYFRSRLLTDMARRGHRLYVLRLLPSVAVNLLQQISLIVFTLIGILWIDFFAGLIACLMAGALLTASIFWQKTLHDVMARAETQTGILGMLYFDTLKGLKVIRSHAAQPTFENEQEMQLSKWGATNYDYQRKQTGALLFLDLFALLVIAALMFNKTLSVDSIAPSVLWFYWVLRLPYLVKHLSQLIMDLPHYKIILSLYTELLEATETEQINATESPSPTKENQSTDIVEKEYRGANIELVNASLNLSGNWVLQDINLNIAAGQHIAIVGESGAGKSSICELLLGWQTPTQGEVKVDGKLLQGETLLQLRQHTAWVDANVQLWDRSLLENLNYDHANGKVNDAGLGNVLAGLANGLQTPLGEDGKRLSGGEGQRVRIARALGVDKLRLVILDEPCRGLDRAAREQLLQKIRTTHAQATLICITHDISEAIKFPHVIVVSQGTLLEQGNPQTLLATQDSAFNYLRECEQKVLHTILKDQRWQQLNIVNGRLQRDTAIAHRETTATPEKHEEDANV